MDILRVFFPEIFFFLLLLHLTLFSSEASGSRIKKRPRLLPNDANELDDFGQERLLPGNNLAAEEADRQRVDPYDSWLSFVNRPDPKRRKGKKKKKILTGPQGSRGPPGPQGPAGPPGAMVTVDILLHKLRQIVKEEAEDKAWRIINSQCSECNVAKNETMLLLSLQALRDAPRVTSAFRRQLRRNTVLLDRTFMELRAFRVADVFGDDGFETDDTPASDRGRFVAQKPGIYQFTANLHLKHQPKTSRDRPRKAEAVRALICLNGRCTGSSVIEMTTGLESSSPVFSLSVTGLLLLEEGQFVSIFLDNSSSDVITVLKDSIFMGHMVAQHSQLNTPD